MRCSAIQWPFALVRRASCVAVIFAVASASAATPPSPEKVAKAAALLIAQGNSALDNQDFKAARDSFSDALSIDPHNSKAAAGLAVAYAGLKQYVKAAPLLDRAALASPGDRLIAYNAAAIRLAAGTPMRGAKIIETYLTAHPTPLDETMANAMAICLNAADEQARKSSFYESVSQFCRSYNTRLEAKAKGLKRWGTEWITVDDYKQKQSEMREQQKSVDALNEKIASDDQQLADLRAQLPGLQQRVNTGFDQPYELDQLNTRINTQADDEKTLMSQRDALIANMPQPQVPTTLDCETAETLPPPGVNPVAIADNTLPPTPPAVDQPDEPAPKPKRKPKPPTFTPGGGLATGANPNDPPIVPKGLTGDTPEPPVTPPTATPPTGNPPDTTPPAAGDDTQAPARKRSAVTQYAAAFPVAPDLLITAAAPLAGASKIELTTADGSPIHAQVVRTDDATGLALLRATDQKMQFLPLAASFRGGAIECAAFPTVDLFNPTVELISGTAPAPSADWKVRLSRHPRLPGAPLIVGAQVVGVQLADRDAENTALPAATLEQLKAFLGSDLPSTPGTASPAAVMLQLSATSGGD